MQSFFIPRNRSATRSKLHWCSRGWWRQNGWSVVERRNACGCEWCGWLYSSSSCNTVQPNWRHQTSGTWGSSCEQTRWWMGKLLTTPHKQHMKKLRSFQLFSVDYTDNIDVLRLIEWIISKKLLYSVTNYYCDNKIVCGAYSRCR